MALSHTTQSLSLFIFLFRFLLRLSDLCVSISFDNNRAASGPLMVCWMGVYSATLYSYHSKDSDTSTKSNSEISQINSFSCFFFLPPFPFGLCLIHIHYAQHNCLRPLFLSAWLAFGLI
jgi:hypothetical protein